MSEKDDIIKSVTAQQYKSYQRLIEQIWLDSDVEKDKYKKELMLNHWLLPIQLMEGLTRREIRRYDTLNLTSIICGIMVAVIVNVIPGSTGTYITTLLGVLIGISGAINQSYKFSDKWKHYLRISEAFKIEGERFFALTGKYQELKTHEGAFNTFMDNVARIREMQMYDFIKNIVNTKEKEAGETPKLHK